MRLTIRRFLAWSVVGIGLALLSPAALALQLEEAQMFVGKAGLYVVVLIMVVGAVFVFMQAPDKRTASLHRVLNETDTAHSVEADALVVECVRKMTDKKIGALLVMDGGKLIGIFTERDALSRVLAAGRDPRDTKVVEVMTTNPYCVSPEMTVGAAMDLVTKKRFRHLPIVEDGKVQAVLSSRDLTHWLAKDRVGEIQELVELANRS